VRAWRVVRSPAAAWVLAAIGAWLVAASCRTLQQRGSPVAVPGASEPPTIAAPLVRVGLLVDADRVSIGADSGLRLRIRTPGRAELRGLPLARATFRAAGAAGRMRLLETGEDVERATLWPAAAGEPVQVDAAGYRGIVEVLPGEGGTLTVVNVLNVEEYLRGVVPNELAPQPFPQLEALKAQAVAARTYVLAHLGESAAKGFDVCATPACQVYKGRGSEHPLTDRAVADTRGVVATWRGRPIHAYYTSTCGGHTEDGGAIFEDSEPYLRGVACEPESSSRQVIRSAARLRRDLPPGPTTARDLALLEALGVLDAPEWAPARLAGIPADAELRAFTDRLVAALHRAGCASPVGGALARRATFVRHLVSSVCWSERAERLLAPGDADYLLQAEDSGQLDDGERPAFALLVHEGLLSPRPDNTLRPDTALSRAEAFALLAGVALRAGSTALRDGELVSVAGGQLRVLHGEAVESYPLDPAVRLLRNLEGVHAAAADLALSIGDHVEFALRDGRVACLEVEQTRRGAAADRSSRYYNWEVRLTPEEVAKAVSRFGSVGAVRDLVPRRLGSSGRVVELAVVGSAGELLLKGLKVRWGLGLRENLFVIDRESGPTGVQRFVITGKGWGHGVGLCQVGAFGMAQAGATYDAILRHYYTGISLTAGN
jgi:stage II sporulation protein D